MVGAASVVAQGRLLVITINFSRVEVRETFFREASIA
jgi:hypothetical protein